MRSGQVTLTQKLLCFSISRRKRWFSGCSTPFVTLGIPMWSTTTVVGSAVKNDSSSGRSGISK